MKQSGVRLFGFAITVALFATAASADVVISSDPTQNMTCSAGVCSPTEKKAVLNVVDLQNLLAASNVTVTTLIVKRRKRADADNIDIETSLSWSSSSKLTLGANRLVRVDAPVTIMGQAGLTITWFLSISPSAQITFWDTASSFSVLSTSFTLVADLPTLVSDITANPSGAYALANDYDAQGDVFPKAPVPEFKGQLDGLGHVLSNLTIKRGYRSCKGLISIGDSTSTVADLQLHAVNVSSDSKSRNVGGIVGCSYGRIYNSSVDGTVNGISEANVGGIAGTIFQGAIQNSRTSATVFGGQAGGIAGENDGQLYAVAANGSVSGNVDVGGLVGLNTGSVDYSYATGPVTGTNNTGGLVGSNHNSVANSYAIGAVSGNGGAAGGLAGFNENAIRYSYSVGPVTGGQGYTGGFVGYDPLEEVTFGYWDTDTSGISDPAQGAGFPTNDPGITGLTTAELQSKLPYGFDKRTWRIDPNVNGGFPYLRYNPPPQGGPKHGHASAHTHSPK